MHFRRFYRHIQLPHWCFLICHCHFTSFSKNPQFYAEKLRKYLSNLFLKGNVWLDHLTFNFWTYFYWFWFISVLFFKPNSIHRRICLWSFANFGKNWPNYASLLPLCCQQLFSVLSSCNSAISRVKIILSKHSVIIIHSLLNWRSFLISCFEFFS